MDLKFILESILFSAQQPLTPKELRDLLVTAAEHDESGGARAFKKTPLENIIAALEELARDHESTARSYRLVCVAGAWQFASQPEFAPWLKALVGHRNRPPRLSAPALETLAIIAYRQPITRAEIEQVRGVAVDGVMQTLLERALVEPRGRAEVVGRPNTYGTTPAFLEYFGLKDLDELPAADELRRIPVTKPDSLLTVDPGLATAPPEQLSLNEESGHPASPAGVDPSAPGAVSSSPASPEIPPAVRPRSSARVPRGESKGGSTSSGPVLAASGHSSQEESPSLATEKDNWTSSALPPDARSLPGDERNLATGEIHPAPVVSNRPPGNKNRAARNVAGDAEPVEVSPADSGLPSTSGTASLTTVGHCATPVTATETTSAEPPAKSRLGRRKKDNGLEN